MITFLKELGHRNDYHVVDYPLVKATGLFWQTVIVELLVSNAILHGTSYIGLYL